METGEQVEGIFGDKLYQRLAKAALPILINYARAGQTVTYQDLARELSTLGIHERDIHHRHIGRIAGSVADTLIDLGKQRDELLPPLSSLVVSKSDGQPGEGVDYFLRHYFELRAVPQETREAYVGMAQQAVFNYQAWEGVLHELGVEPFIVDPNNEATAAAAESGGWGGEGPEHKALKEFIGDNPGAIGLKRVNPPWYECPLGSGDRLDIFFESPRQWTGVEVKSHLSDDADVLRGIYQCVKYQAVLEAERVASGFDVTVRAILVLGGTLSQQNRRLKDLFDVEVFEGVRPIS